MNSATVINGMPWIIAIGCFCLLATTLPGAESRTPVAGTPWKDIRDFGAVGDGKTFCTDAIRRAVETAVEGGGGTVFFPAGNWLTGTIELKSHVTLHLAPGCTILASTNISDYPEYTPAIRSLTDHGTRRSLIYAENLDHIGIEGAGTIEGNGGAFPRKHGPQYDRLRPNLLKVVSCRDVRVEGVFLRNPAIWTQHYLACERLRITGIRVWGFANYNNDGIDIDGCRDVLVSSCIVDSEDDGIVLKSTSPHPCRNVVISDCLVSSRSSPIKLGTESMGGFQDIAIANCTIRPVDAKAPRILTDGRNGLTGVELIIADGGRMERVAVNNVTIEGMQVPLSVRLGARGRGIVDPETFPKAERPPRLPVGTVKDITFANIVATGAARNCGILLLGHTGHPLENISLANITLRNAGGGEAKLAAREVPERAYDYPQAAYWGDLPAYGLYARHVRGLRLSGVRLETVAPDARHALVLDDVRSAGLEGVDCMPGSGTNALLRLSETRDALIRGCRPIHAEGAFLKVEGAGSSGIALAGNDCTRVERIAESGPEIRPDAMREAGNVKPSD